MTSQSPASRLMRGIDVALLVTLATAYLYILGFVGLAGYLSKFGLSVFVVGPDFEQVVSRWALPGFLALPLVVGTFLGIEWLAQTRFGKFLGPIFFSIIAYGLLLVVVLLSGQAGTSAAEKQIKEGVAGGQCVTLEEVDAEMRLPSRLLFLVKSADSYYFAVIENGVAKPDALAVSASVIKIMTIKPCQPTDVAKVPREK